MWVPTVHVQHEAERGVQCLQVLISSSIDCDPNAPFRDVCEGLGRCLALVFCFLLFTLVWTGNDACSSSPTGIKPLAIAARAPYPDGSP